MRPTLCLLALLVGVLVPTGAAAAPISTALLAAEDSIGVRLLDAPSDRRDDPRARLYIVDHVAPGTTVERRVEVSNSTPRPATISVYPGSAAIADGLFTLGEAGTPNELTTWVSADRQTVQLPAGGRSPVTVTIAVPDDAAPGERYGVIWAEVSARAPDAGGVTVVNRVGIRVYLSVGRGGEPPPGMQVEDMTAERSTEGQPVVRVLVRNTGGRALDISGSLSLSRGPGALSAGPFPAELGTTLAPGDAAPVTVVLDRRLPDGPWHARLDVRSGLLKRTAEGTITFPAAVARDADPVPVQAAGRGLVWVGWALGAAILVALLLFLLLRRRRRRRPGGPPAVRPPDLVQRPADGAELDAAFSGRAPSGR